MKNKINEELTQENLKELLYYDPDTGIFKWIERPIDMFSHCKNPQRACNTWNARYANKIAGYIWTSKKAKVSYLIIRISLNGKIKDYKVHRLAILYTDGDSPPEQVDHIDGDGLNNRRNNLREVTAKENHKNMPMRSDNTSGCTGVYWYKASQKWHVQININGKQIHGGYFINKDDAKARRKELEIEHGYHKNHGRE